MALIYIVEDDESIREIETISLRNSGYEVCCFEDAGSFFEGLDKMLPDLLVLDIMLPDSDGNTMVKRLRRMPETKKLPIIMVTAKTSEMDLMRGLDNGADDYIKKPFSQKILLARISNLLRKSEPAASSAELITADFNDTERKVAELIVKGYSGKEICDKLFYSYSYIKKLLASMREKCGCETLGDLKKILCGSFEQKK